MVGDIYRLGFHFIVSEKLICDHEYHSICADCSSVIDECSIGLLHIYFLQQQQTKQLNIDANLEGTRSKSLANVGTRASRS